MPSTFRINAPCCFTTSGLLYALSLLIRCSNHHLVQVQSNFYEELIKQFLNHGLSEYSGLKAMTCRDREVLLGHVDKTIRKLDGDMHANQNTDRVRNDKACSAVQCRACLAAVTLCYHNGFSINIFC